MSVAIIGGGITGLTAAFRLLRAGVSVTVYEAAGQAGGVIRTCSSNGFLAEAGPNTILETAPAISELIHDLRLEPQRLYSNPDASNRYVLRGGKPIAVPDSPVSMFASPLFSRRAKLRLLAEPFVRCVPADWEENVSEFVLRRLGREFLDYAVDPMIGGIYAGDPRRLSVKHAFPKLHALEQRYGSLILGQILGARERRRRKEISKQSAPKFSFRDGLQTLIDTLHREMPNIVRLNSSVTALHRTSRGWRATILNNGAETATDHEAVLLAAPAFKLAKIPLHGIDDTSLAPLGEINYAPVASIALGFRRDQVAHPLDGFGVLVPTIENRHILGALFSSSLFPHRAPDGHVLISCYMGGERSPHLANCGLDAAIRYATNDLRSILGIQGDPVFVKHTAFPKAIPQYEVGFGKIKDWMSQLELKAAGLFLAGHFRDGISLSDSIISGTRAADRISAFLRTEPHTEHELPSQCPASSSNRFEPVALHD